LKNEGGKIAVDKEKIFDKGETATQEKKRDRSTGTTIRWTVQSKRLGARRDFYWGGKNVEKKEK